MSPRVILHCAVAQEELFPVSTATVIFSKSKLDCVTSLLKNFQWLPAALRIKSMHTFLAHCPQRDQATASLHYLLSSAHVTMVPVPPDGT